MLSKKEIFLLTKMKENFFNRHETKEHEMKAQAYFNLVIKSWPYKENMEETLYTLNISRCEGKELDKEEIGKFNALFDDIKKDLENEFKKDVKKKIKKKQL